MNADSHEIPGLREVAAAYARASGTEQPPDALDRTIRRAAADEARRRRRYRSSVRTWMVGGAVAATVMLALAGLLPGERETPLPAAARQSPDTSGRAVAPRDRSGSVPGGAPDAAAPLSGKVTLDPGSPPAETESPPTGAAGESGECSAVVDVASSWLACIATLQRAGRIDAAARELESFRDRFVDYALPAELDPTPPR